MAKLYNLARVATATVGLGNVSLGAAVSGYITWVQSGVQNGDVVSYALHDFVAGVVVASEAGRGTYNAGTNTFSRDTVLDSTNGGAKINLSGNAQAIITFLAEDYTASEIGADPAGTAAASMVTHLAAANPHPQYIITETDPIFSASPSFSITALDIASWNAKQSALTFPLAASLGGTGIANGASASLTLPNLAITLGGGGAAQTYTLPAAGGTFALLNAANVFTNSNTISGNAAGFSNRHLILKNTTTGTGEQSRIEFLNDSGLVATDSGGALFYTATNFSASSILNRAVGFWNYQAGAIIFATSAVARMYITSDGKVSVGTHTTPQNLFHVQGSVKITEGVGDNQGSIAFGNNSTSAGYIGLCRGGLGVTTGGDYLNLAGYGGVVITASAAAMGSQTVRMIITAGGLVTFGTATGTARHSIIGSTDIVQNYTIGHTTQTAAPNLFVDNTAATNTIRNVLQLEAQSTGTAAAGLGAGLLFSLETATASTNKNAGRLWSKWVVPTNGSETSAVGLDAYTNSTAQEFISGQGDTGGVKLAFFGGTRAAKQTLNAYTSDGEGAAYTGIDNLQIGTVYATVVDLNQLRVAYETLRASYDDLRTKLQTSTLIG